MSAPRKLKKSETLEIRIPYPTKQAFMARCQADGVSASEALRSFIDGQLAPAPAAAAPRRRTPKLLIGGLIAAAVGAIAVPSLAGPSVAAGLAHDLVSRVAFERIDANHDGSISYAEYRAARDAAGR
jgi:hypothetical protein